MLVRLIVAAVALLPCSPSRRAIITNERNRGSPLHFDQGRGYPLNKIRVQP